MKYDFPQTGGYYVPSGNARVINSDATYDPHGPPTNVVVGGKLTRVPSAPFHEVLGLARCPDCGDRFTDSRQKLDHYERTCPGGKRRKAGLPRWLVVLGAFVAGLWSSPVVDLVLRWVSP